MVSNTISNEIIIKYMQRIQKKAKEGSLIRDEYLTGEKWNILEQKALQRIQECPEDAFPIDALAHHYLNRKQFQKAIELYKIAVKVAPESASIQHHLAIGYYCHGDTAQALKEFRKINVNQLNKEGMYTINWQTIENTEDDYNFNTEEHWEDDSFEEEDFEEIFQYTIRTLHHNANMYTQMGVYEFAIECFQQLLKLTFRAPCILNQLGVTYAFAREYKQAKKIFNEALQGNPGLENAYSNLANVHILLEEFELAVGVLKKASSKYPTETGFLIELALAYEGLDYPNKVINCLAKSLKMDPNSFTEINSVTSLRPFIGPALELAQT